MQDLIKEFMAQKRFAVVGATTDAKKYGNEIFRNLISRGYEVYPVSLKLKELERTKCYPSLSDIPVKVDVVDFAVPPSVTEEILKECKELEQRFEAIISFLESPELKKLRNETERYLSEGKQVKVNIHSVKGKIKYELKLE